MYTLIDLNQPNNIIGGRIIDTNKDIAPLFSQLENNQVIIKGKKQEIVAGKPASMLDIMNREYAHNLPQLIKVINAS